MDPIRRYVEEGDSSRPSKRQKRQTTGEDANDAKGKQSKACAHCRKLKVRCDSGDEQDTGSGCSRCRRLGLTCLREKKSWASAAEDDAWQTKLTILKLERALEDILEKLSMPALDLYVSPAIVKQPTGRPTRPNSEDRGEKERDVSPDPMNSLIEATQLNGLR